jgi:hypothetical protein
LHNASAGIRTNFVRDKNKTWKDTLKLSMAHMEANLGGLFTAVLFPFS